MAHDLKHLVERELLQQRRRHALEAAALGQPLARLLVRFDVLICHSTVIYSSCHGIDFIKARGRIVNAC